MSPLLPIPFIVHTPWLYVLLYAVIGMTDILDGRIARHFHVESEIGERLDVFGDILFFLCIAASLLVPPRLEFEVAKSLFTISFILVFKLVVILVTRVKFKFWSGMMHTYLDKTIGFLQFFAVPIFIVEGKIRYAVILTITIVQCLSAVEEVAILLTSETYNANHKGIVVEKFLSRRNKKSA